MLNFHKREAHRAPFEGSSSKLMPQDFLYTLLEIPKYSSLSLQFIPRRLRLPQACTQTLSQNGEMFGSTGHVIARNDMDVYLFLCNQLTPSLLAPGLLIRPKERDLARIGVRHVTGSLPIIDTYPDGRPLLFMLHDVGPQPFVSWHILTDY